MAVFVIADLFEVLKEILIFSPHQVECIDEVLGVTRLPDRLLSVWNRRCRGHSIDVC